MLQRVRYSQSYGTVDYAADVTAGHEVLINNGYTNWNKNEMNVPLIKMIYKGPNRQAVSPAPPSAERINYAKVLIFTSSTPLPLTLRHQASFPEAKYMFHEK